MTPTLQFRPVNTKADFARRYYLGEFGNRSPTWNTLEEFNQDGYDGLVHLRNRVTAGETYYDLRPKELRNLWPSRRDPEQWYCSAMVPKEVETTLLIQGEVQQTYPGSGRCGLDLFYSQVPKPMRVALAEKAEQISGIIASFLLRRYLCPNSYEWLQELLDRYPYHVVEFSTYARCWGTLYPRFNTIFWEVRNY